MAGEADDDCNQTSIPRFLSDLTQGSKHVSIEQFSWDAAVTSLDISILHRLTRLDEYQSDFVLFAPGFKFLADKFRSIIHPDHLGQTSKFF
jgi:hypothetical protein